MLKKGEIVKIKRIDNILKVEIVELVNITVNRRWYDFDINLNAGTEEAPANYRIEENYIGKTTDCAGNICIGQVCKYLYVNDNDKVFATEIVSHI